eukprot:937327-Amphidinium_carterae.2
MTRKGHEEFLDGRGCLYIAALDAAITVEEPAVQVEWNRPVQSASTMSTAELNYRVKESFRLVMRR